MKWHVIFSQLPREKRTGFISRNSCVMHDGINTAGSEMCVRSCVKSYESFMTAEPDDEPFNSFLIFLLFFARLVNVFCVKFIFRPFFGMIKNKQRCRNNVVSLFGSFRINKTFIPHNYGKSFESRSFRMTRARNDQGYSKKK